MNGSLLLNHARSAERIWMKFGKNIDFSIINRITRFVIALLATDKILEPYTLTLPKIAR